MSVAMIAPLIRIVKQLGAQFYLNNKLITPEEILSETGLLPALARRADQLCTLCLGYGIGVSYDEAEPSILGVKVIFDDVTPALLRYITIVDVLMDLLKSSQSPSHVDLDELLYD